MSTLRAFIKIFFVAVAAMYLTAWHLAPASLSLVGTVNIAGTIARETSSRIDQLRIDTGGRVYSTRCVRAAALCDLAARSPGTRIQANLLESPFANDNWIVQAVADGAPVLTLEHQQIVFKPYQQQLVWNAVASAVAALAAVLLVRKRPRPRNAA